MGGEQRGLLEGLVAQHLRKHRGDPGASLAAVNAGRSTRENLAKIGDRDIDATLTRVGSGSAERDDPDRTGTYSVGSATSEGQRFRVLRPHARCGLGAVFMALDGELHREVALKQILVADGEATAYQVRRFNGIMVLFRPWAETPRSRPKCSDKRPGRSRPPISSPSRSLLCS